MSYFPSRCHHIKVNGTQCGSPALRTGKLCFFHQRSEDGRAQLIADRAAKRASIIDLPVLEDANSIQISITQIMRLIVAGQIDAKTAGLLLYALQTASANLRCLQLNPYLHNVVVDPQTVDQTRFNDEIWKDSDFITQEQYEAAERAQAVAAAEREAKKRAQRLRWAEDEANRIMAEGDRERAVAAEKEKKARAAELKNTASRSSTISPAIAPPVPKPATSVAPAASATAATLPAPTNAIAASVGPSAPATKPAATKTPPPRLPASAKPAPLKSISLTTIALTSIEPTSVATKPTIDPAGRVVVRTAPPLPRPPRRFPPYPTIDEIRKSVRDQILYALPEVTAAFAERRNRNNTG